MRLPMLGRATRRPAARLTSALLLTIATLGAAGAPAALAQTETTTVLAAEPASPVWGQAVTFTATVTPANEGTVTFKEGTTDLAAPVPVDTTGQAALTLASPDVRAHSGIAAYYTDATGTFKSSDSSAHPLTITVAKASSALSASFSPPTIVPGQFTVATVTAAAVAPGAGTPTGQIVFAGSAMPLDSGRVRFGLRGEAGTYPFGITYAGDDHFDKASDATASLQIDKADTSMTLTSSANPVEPGGKVTFTAMLDVAAPADLDPFGGPQGSFQFTLDGRPFGPPLPLEGYYGYDVTITAPAVPLTAVVGVGYSGDANSKPSSASLPWTVAPAATPPAGGGATPSALSALNAMRTALATALRKGGLKALTSTQQAFNAPGPGVLDQKVFTPTAPKSALKAAKKPVLIASATRRIAAAGPVTFKLKATAAGKRMLRKARSLKLAIVTRFTPSGGDPVIVVSRLTVKARAKQSATALFGWHGWRVERLDR
jgi:hypothetical protein